MTEAATQPSGAPGASELLAPVETMTPEQAQAEISSLKNNTDFYKKLIAKDPEANARWTGLHKQGFPAPQQVASIEDVNVQANARREEAVNDFIAGFKAQWNVTIEQEAEIRNGVIREDIYKFAQEEKARLIADRVFRAKLLEGSRPEREQWGRVTAALSLRPVKVK